MAQTVHFRKRAHHQGSSPDPLSLTTRGFVSNDLHFNQRAEISTVPKGSKDYRLFFINSSPRACSRTSREEVGISPVLYIPMPPTTPLCRICIFLSDADLTWILILPFLILGIALMLWAAEVRFKGYIIRYVPRA